MDDIEEWYFNMRFIPALPTRNELKFLSAQLRILQIESLRVL